MADERILVADDEPSIVHLCERILSREGYTVQGVTSGQEAIAWLEAERWDLLLVDIKMPDIDGLAVLRRGREIDPLLTAVVITGHTTLENAIATLHAGAHRLVLKPFSSAELIPAVQDALAQGHSEQERQRLRAQLPILQIAQALATEGDPGLLAERLLEPVVREVPADRSVLLLAESGDDLTVAGAIGLPPDQAPDARQVRLSRETTAPLQAGSEPLLLEGAADLAPSLQPLLHLPEGAWVVWLPLRTLKRCVGALVLARSSDRLPFTPAELSLLSIVGGQVAAAIENAKLYEMVARGKREWEETFDAIADGISIHDAEWRIVRANRALARRLGMNVRDLIGRRCYEAVHRSAEPPEYCPLRAALASNQPQEMEIEDEGLAGIFQCQVYPVRGEKDHSWGAVHVLRDVTARRRAERALRKSEARYRALVESSSDQTFMLSREGIYLTSNDRVQHLGTANGAALVGQQLRDVYPPQVAELYGQRLEQVLASGQAVDFEHSLPTADGERYYLDTLYPIRQDGAMWAVGGISRDITARRQAENLIRAQRDMGLALAVARGIEQTLRLCLETAIRVSGMDCGGIYLVSPSADLDLAAQQGFAAQFVERTAHFPRDSENARLVLAGRPIYSRHQELGVPLEGARLREGLRAIAVIPVSHEGEVIACLNVASHALDQVPEFARMALEAIAGQIGSAIARAQAEEVLHHRNEELTALNAIAMTIGQSLDLPQVLDATLDKVLEILEMDGGWVQLLDEESGALTVAAHRHIPATLVQEIGALRLGEGPIGLLAQSGEPVVARADSPPLLLPEEAVEGGAAVRALIPIRAKDQVVGILGIFGRTLRELSPGQVQILRAIGHQLGVAVENARLARQSAEIQVLRELDRLRSEIIANVSHELRTPLGLIKIFATTLLREDLALDGATQREFLTDVADETGKLEKIVDNLLDLSRLEDRRLLLHKEPTDLRWLAQRVIATMQAQSTEHRLVDDFPVEALVVEADPQRIEQVLRNLLDNAMKYSPGGGTIQVQGRQEGPEIVVRVSDQGLGIPSADLERVFERFHRVENELTMRQRGAGLGLAVCRGVIEAHGGRIWAASTPGAGSTFTFTLPAGGQVEPL